MSNYEHQELLTRYLKDIQLGGGLSKLSYQKGQKLYEMGHCHLLTSSPERYVFKLADDYQDFEVEVHFDGQKIINKCSCQSMGICSHSYAAFLQTHQELSRSLQPKQEGAIKYSREGMMERVLEERKQRAKAERYELDFADNIYGEHLLKNAKGNAYHLSFYDFDKKLGYCSCPDYQTNKLETCKHLMYAFDVFEKQFASSEIPQQSYPFLEIFRHPLYDYRISWFYPHKLPAEIQSILNDFFDQKQLLLDGKINDIHVLLEKLQSFKWVKIRPEVTDYISSYFDDLSLRKQFSNKDFHSKLLLKNIYPFQKEGIQFISSRKGSILADEIGMGKSVQALGAALHKINILGFNTVNILCPEQLSGHWESELKTWVPVTKLKHFKLGNFEQINPRLETDFLIIDEAQKIDDYASGLLHNLHQIKYKHILLITDSRIENSLIKFYAMAGLIDQHLLNPLWELSYNHCLFSANNPSKIVGYYNMEKLKKKLTEFYLRRNRSDIKLPDANRIVIPVALNQQLKTEQSRLVKKIVELLEKKTLSQYNNLQLKWLLQQLLKLAQFHICSAKGQKLIPKMQEFQHFVLHKLDVRDKEKVIVFTDDTRVQEQLKRFFDEHEKPVQILDTQNPVFSESADFYITSEQQQDLPPAHHYLFFHVPDNYMNISSRLKFIDETPSNIKPNSIYVFQTSKSLEEIWYSWSESKTFFMQQLNDFLTKGLSLNLRLQEDLLHELKKLIIPSQKQRKTSSEIQMPNTIAVFFEKLTQTFHALEKTDQEFKELFKKGKIEISKESEDYIIRFKH